MGEFSGARTGESLERRVSRLEDIEAIQRVKAAYAKFCDNGYDADGMADLFVDDATWESNAFGTYHGRDEIHRFVANIGHEILWATHFMICPNIDVAEDGMSATGEWYLLELATMPSTAGGDARDSVVMTATYHDEFVKRDGEWRIRRVVADFQHVSNLDVGWARQQFR
jgi:uncharacterized protein (TIGR02246 family)